MEEQKSAAQSVPRPPLYLARHAETAFNHARRMQGGALATPLTRRGIGQAEDMGRRLRAFLANHGEPPPILWSSPAGRALQTASIIAEHLGIDFFSIRQDERLRELEVGRWAGRSHADIRASEGEIFEPEHHLFRTPIPGGEQYADVARRLRSWLDDFGNQPALVISHGMASRVLRGLILGGISYDGIEVADELPQGRLARIANGREEIL